MKPNIVFFFTDDQRFDTIAALGNPQIRTPHMDGLVARGTAFTHAFIPGGTVGAVCMPSRAMLNTGRTLFHIEGAGASIPCEHTTLGEALRGAGYETFGTGKWHNGTESFHRSFSSGGEIFFGGMADHWNVPVFEFDPAGKYDKRCLYVENPTGSNRTAERFCDHIHAGRHSTDIISETGIRFLQGHPAGRPYFLQLSFLAPHDPRTMPEEFLKMYDPAGIELPANFMERHPFDNGEMKVRDELLAGFPRDGAEIRRHLADYYAMITHLDDRIGQVIAAVRARGELDNTIFVLCGDNGLALGQHGLMGKQSLYDHSLRVPMVLCGPGIAAGKTSDALVYLLDLFPTLCGLTGTPVPASVEGRSLLASPRDALYLAYAGKHRGVRTRRHKLIEYVVNGRHAMTQVFDMVSDPLETRNLACDAELLESLRGELFRLRDEWGDRDSSWGQEFWKGYAS
ncbi:MAG: sulfatase-like hydrolase/transferase [Spartobacteria bacterium]